MEIYELLFGLKSTYCSEVKGKIYLIFGIKIKENCLHSYIVFNMLDPLHMYLKNADPKHC
jgi:hypothetical protein